MDSQDIKEFKAILNDIRENEKKHAFRANVISGVSLAIVAIMAIIFLTVIPKVMGIITDAQKIIDDASIAVENLTAVSNHLNEVDLPELFAEVDTLVDSSQSSVNAAAKKIEAIDVEGLNEAITSLKNIVGPIGKLLGGFSR